MTVSFADQFDIPQFSKKYSVILKGVSVSADVVQPASYCVSAV